MKKGPQRFQEARFMKHMELKILWTCGLLMMCLQDVRSANPDIKLLTSSTVWKGSCLMLPCTYNAKVTSDKIIWFHNAEYDYLNHKFFGAVVYDSKNITNVDQLFAGRVEFIGNLKKDPADCTIVIKDIQSQHEGRYQLRLWGKSDKDKWMFQNITVTAPETGPTLQIDSPTEMRESDTVSITCNIQYYCPFNNITLYWIEEMNGTSTTDISKDRNGLRTGTSSRLEIHPSWKDDKKNVTCVLEGDNGEAENQTIQLNVKHAPKNVQVLPKNATIKIKQNQSVTLTCSVESSNPPDYEITWFKDNRPQRQTSKNGSPNQFEVRYPGKYFCKAKNILGEMPSNSVEVIVLHPPEKTVIKKPQGMLKEGMDISLECSTKANPPAFLYIWYKDSEMCYNNTSAWFRISKITEDDSGSYTCLARNELGESRSDVVELDVMYAPRYPKIYLQRGEEQFDEKEQFIFVEGDRVNFECKVNSSNPDVTELLWNKNGKSIGKTSNPIKAEDAGSYTCEAKNNIGSSTSLPVNLEVLYPPKGVDIVIPKRKVKENETVRLKCISNTSKPEIKAYEWYKDSVLLQSSSSDVLELRLEWTHTGSYSCKALNDIGSGMSSMKQIDVQYAPQNVTLKVIPGEHVTEFTDVKLTCTSKANPDVLGYKFYRNNVLLGDRNRYVDLTDVKIENAGAYYCTVENDVGEGRSNVISLHVSYSQATIGKLSAIWIFSIIALLLLIYLSVRFGICIRNAFRKKGVNDKGDSSFFILKKTNQESADNTGRQMSMMHSSTDHLNYSTVNLPPPSRKRINPPSTTPDNDITTVYSVVGKVRNAAEYENISTSKTNHEDSQDDIHYSIITNLNKNTKNLERDPDVEYAKLRHS